MMDSLSNGEVSDDCLNMTKNLCSEKELTDSKHKNETKDDLETESLETDASKVKVHEIGSTVDPIDSVKSEKECLLQKGSLSDSFSVPKPTADTNIIISSVITTEDNLQAESAKSVAKENGISVAENLFDECENKSSSSSGDKIETEEVQELTGIDTSNKFENVESLCQKAENSLDSEHLTKVNSDVESPACCSKQADDKDPGTPLSSVDKDSPVCEHNSQLNDLEKVEGILGTVTKPEVISKNHFMAGGSIISSTEDQDGNKKLDLNHSSKILEVDQIIDFSNKMLENSNKVVANSSDASTPLDCDEHPLNFITSKKTESSENNSSNSESYELVDLSVNKQPQESNSDEIKPLEKLNERLVPVEGDQEQNAVHNLTQKVDIPPVSITSSPVVITKTSDSHLICDKENKCADPSQSQERLSKESSDSFVFADLSNEETGFPDAFTGLVTIGKYISVKGDFTLRSSEALVESPSLVAPYLLKEPDSFPPKDKDSKSEIKDFFHSAAGEILIGIGLSRVNEWFHKDMVRIKKRQLKRNKTPELEEDLAAHETYYSEAKKANNVYSFDFRVCKTCGFTTESSVVMEGHLLVPHITQRREYQCNYCDVINRDPKGMLQHMQEIHKKIGRIQPPVLFFECPYCTFESNSKVKLNHHLLKCQRVYDQGINQAPSKDFEFPALTPKPITVAVVKAYEKSLGSMQRGRGRPKKDLSESMHMNQFSSNANLSPLTPNHPPFRGGSNSPLADSLMQNQIMSSVQMPNMNLRPAHSGTMGQLRPGMSTMHMPGPNRFFGVVNPTGQLMPLMGNNHLVTSPSQFPFSSNLDNSGGKKSSSSQYYNKVFDMSQRQQNSSKGMSSVTITPLPKLTGPYPVPMAKPATASGSNSMQSNSLVVCEICDGYIKDLEQLRTHMQLIHKVKIHPKMLVSRPPLNCQKCQWRFFTDQGLERHLLGAHGLVTSNMQELANKGKDAGCCTICGRVYASKLVSHMNQVHKVTLKPAHLSYKCTVCSATFNLYRLFENHVYLVHSGAGKRSADGRSSPSKKLKSAGDSPADGESLNHKEKRLSTDIGDENVKKCKLCGTDMSEDKKSQNDKCEKCLKSDELVQGTVSAKTLKDELKKKDKAIEKAAV